MEDKKIVNVGVVGAGSMGRELAFFLLLNNACQKIYWMGAGFSNSGMLKNYLEEYLARAIDKGRITPAKRLEVVSKLQIITNLAEIEKCEIVHEAVEESLDLKLSILKRIEEVVSDHALIATNTSSISIEKLAASLRLPNRFLGIHFFNPISVMKLVEVVHWKGNSENVLALAVDYVESLEKVPVVVKDSPGFIVNRILVPMINDAISVLDSGITTKESIDLAMKMGANCPLGPIALSDMIGNDVVLNILNNMYQDTGDERFKPSPLLLRTVAMGCLGRKSGKGFYAY